MHAETKVGTRLKEEIQKNVVSMILLIMLSIPLLNMSTWFNNTTSYEKGPYQLAYFAGNNPTQIDPVFSAFITEMMQRSSPLVYFSTPVNTTCCEFPKNFHNYTNSVKSLDSIRSSDISIYVANVPNSENQVTVAFDQTAQSIM